MNHFCVPHDYKIGNFFKINHLFNGLIDKIMKKHTLINLSLGIKISQSQFIYLPLISLGGSLIYLFSTLYFPTITYINAIIFIFSSICFLDLKLLDFLQSLFTQTFQIKMILAGISTMPSFVFLWLLLNYSNNYKESILDIYNNSLWKYQIHLPIIVAIILFSLSSVVFIISSKIIINLISKSNSLLVSVLHNTEIYQSFELSYISIIQIVYIIFLTLFIIILLSQIGKYINAQNAYLFLTSQHETSLTLLKNIPKSILFLLRYHFGSIILITYRSIYLQCTITNIINPNRKENFAHLVKNNEYLISNNKYNHQYIRVGLMQIASISILLFAPMLYKTLLGVYCSFCIWMILSLQIANWVLSYPPSFNDILNVEKEVASSIPHIELSSSISD